MSALRITCLATVLAGTGLLAACGYHVQDTSGRTFLDREPSLAATPPQTASATRPGAATDFRRELRAAADVEPRLTFPARIGLARVERGEMTAIPPAEAEAWMKMAEKLGPRFGTFVPVSPLVVELVASEADDRGKERRLHRGIVAELVRKLRLGAARQHVDAMLIYEVTGHANDKATLLSVTDLSIVGLYVVPSRHLAAEGFASALLLDVRNGYPYGTATARSGDTDLVRSVGSEAKRDGLLQTVRTAAAVNLVGEVEKMAEAIYRRGGAQRR